MTFIAANTSNPLEVPKSILQWLVANGPSCNVILPALEKAIHTAQQNGGCPPTGHLWVWIQDGEQILAVAALTDTYMGTKYPLFIVSTPHAGGYKSAILELAMTLRDLSDTANSSAKPIFSRSRVFSVFADAQTSIMFARRWQQLTGINHLRDFYYEAWLSTMTATTLTPRFSQLSSNQWIGPADTEDVEELGRHCFEFASEVSVQSPFGRVSCIESFARESRSSSTRLQQIKRRNHSLTKVSFGF